MLHLRASLDRLRMAIALQSTPCRPVGGLKLNGFSETDDGCAKGDEEH